MECRTPRVLIERIEREKQVVASDEFRDAVEAAAADVALLPHYHDQRQQAAASASDLSKRFDVGWFLCETLVLDKAGVLRRDPQQWWEAAGLCAVNERGERSNGYTGFIRTIL